MVTAFAVLSLIFIFHLEKFLFDSVSKEVFLFTNVDSVPEDKEQILRYCKLSEFHQLLC